MANIKYKLFHDRTAERFKEDISRMKDALAQEIKHKIRLKPGTIRREYLGTHPIY